MSAGAARLQFAIKTLRERWDATREQWADQVAREFEKNHLDPLEHQVTHTLRAMAKISEVLAKAKHDVS